MPQGPGPNYPHPNPVPGSNAIGSFQIGVSPIGDITPFDFVQTVLAQYANSSTLFQLIADMAQYFDLTADWDAFFDTVWNADTAVGYGLDRIGRIVGVTRVFNVGSAGSFFGFEGSDPSATGFGPDGGPFFSGQQLTTQFALSDDAFRVLIFAKALANISDGSIPSINQLLLNLFPHRGNCYVSEGHLTMTYTFTFGLTPVEQAIVAQSGVLPRTSGVATSVSLV